MSATDPGRSGREASPATSSNAQGRRVERRKDPCAREQLVQRVLSEFHEMPCLRLTPEQAWRLFGLSPDVTNRIIHTLILEGHVRQDADGRFVATKMS